MKKHLCLYKSCYKSLWAVMWSAGCVCCIFFLHVWDEALVRPCVSGSHTQNSKQLCSIRRGLKCKYPVTFDLQSTRGHRWSQCPQAASGSMENPYRTGRPTHSWYTYTLLNSATEHCVSAAQIWSTCSSMRCSNDFHSWISAFLEVSLCPLLYLQPLCWNFGTGSSKNRLSLTSFMRSVSVTMTTQKQLSVWCWACHISTNWCSAISFDSYR